MARRPVQNGAVMLRFHETFDAPDAGRVREAIAAQDDGVPLVIDFSQVRHFQDYALARIAPDLAGATGRRRIRLHGLGPHQLRLLGYFGFRQAAGETQPADGAA
jgi:hypothetical protein